MNTIFIPELKEKIIEDLVDQGFNAGQIHNAMIRWEKNLEPRSVTDHGFFEIFKKIEADINAQ